MITIIGLGFVGLTTALGFAEKGEKVYGFEINKNKKDLLARGQIPFYEPHLEEMINKHSYNGNFVLTENLKKALSFSEIAMICVGTPSKETGEVDISQIKNAIDLIILNSSKKKITICIKSTIPPSTTQNDLFPYILKKSNLDPKSINLANNPEFLREGHAWNDFIKPDRIVIGSLNDSSKKTMNNIYRNFDAEVINVNLNTAEFIKYLSNSFLATLISYSNELQMIAHSIGDINIKESFRTLHKDKRWFGSPCNMSRYTYPGFGFGGYCLPKDTLGIIQKSAENNYEANLLNEVMIINKKIKDYMINKIIYDIPKDTKIAILGLSFKPLSDDVRMTSAAYLIEELLKKGYFNINAYDPISNSNFKQAYNFEISYFDNLKDILTNSSMAIIVTAWPEFKSISKLNKNIKICDLRFFL